MKAELMNEALTEVAKIAILLEDNAPEVMGSDYSVNVNFRRDGGELHTSIEVYGAKHASGYKGFSIQEIQKFNQIVRMVKLPIMAIMAAGIAFILSIVFRMIF